MGELAVATLARSLAGQAPGSMITHLPTILRIRGSTAPPPHRSAA